MPRPLLIALLLLTIARWLLGASFELADDEAYYYQWSQRLDWSYYSKGPGIALAMWTSSSILGDSAWAIRFFSPLCALISSVLIWKLTRQLFSERSALWAVVVLNCTPIFNVGSVVFTIDALLIPAWLAAMYCFWKATSSQAACASTTLQEPRLLAKPRRTNWLWWLGCGIALALGFLAKYTMLVILPSLLVWLFWHKDLRRNWLRIGPYLMLLGASLGFVPVVIWNAQNEWITLTHLLERGRLDEATGLHPLNLIEYFAYHLGVYSPLIALGSFAVIVFAWKAARNPECKEKRANAYLLATSMPLLIGYFLLNLKELAEANWTAPAMLGLGILFAHHLSQASWSMRKRRRLFVASAVTGMVMVCLILCSDFIRAAGVPWAWSKDLTARLRGHAQAAQTIVQLANKQFGQEEQGIENEFFLIADKWQIAANLDYTLQRASDPLPLLRPTPNYPRVHMKASSKIANQYSFWQRYDAFSHPINSVPPSPFFGANALYISATKRTNPPYSVRDQFESTQPIGQLTFYRQGMPIRQWFVFACINYRGQTL